MITLTKDQVIMLHKCIYDRYGGSYGLRDEGLLDSALMAPFQTFAGEDLYPEDKDKIAHMAYALISNHPFHDGNKRIGALALLTLLKIFKYSPFNYRYCKKNKNFNFFGKIILTNDLISDIIYLHHKSSLLN